MAQPKIIIVIVGGESELALWQLPTLEGREIRLRRIARLDDQQQNILHQLKITLPERLEPLRIQKCREDSAIA